MWLKKLVVERFIEEKIWEKHRVKLQEVEEALTSRHSLRLRHRKDPARSVIIGATQIGRLLKIILKFQGRGRYFLVTAMELNAKERRQYGTKIKGHS